MDDVSLWISHPDPNEAIRMLNADLASIYNWSIFNQVCFDASKFHLFDLGKLDFSQELLDSVIFGDVHPSWTNEAPFLGAILDDSLSLVAFMKDRARKAEAVRWRVLNHARQRTGPAPATLSIIFMLYTIW